MRFTAAGALVFCFTLAASAQSTKPKPKPTPAKKTTAAKPQPGSSKPKTSTVKTKSAAPAKTKATAVKPKTTAVKPKITKKPVEEPKPDEKAEWEKASAVTEPAERISAMRKFISIFPAAEKLAEARTMIVTSAFELGNAALVAGDAPKAAEYFKIAATDAPVPAPDALFNDTLAKIPANLYFRGARKEALEIAGLIEEKSSTSVDQLLAIASFYMSVENGAEARRVAEHAIKTAPASSPAYQTLGLASRIDFRLDESAAAYAKALELDPESLSARRGLAEMKRAVGKADEAAALYREILAKDGENVPAQTGLVLALLDGGKQSDAEAEMAKLLEANPGNVILLASAAYWYAVNKNGDKAIALAQQAITSDPRFIWSHIALARGYLNQNKAAAAEKTLLAARRYGNFPTLEYEIASAKLAAGFYREAAEELSKSFSVKDGSIKTNLGGRVTRESKDFTELVGFERRASIFAPTAADSPENAQRLTALLELKQQFDAAEPNAEAVSKAVDDLVRGDDKMRVHRQLFAANQLLERRILLPKVLELAKTAVSGVDAGLEVAAPSAAVMASELYENRTLAMTKGEYVDLPEVPRQTLSSIMRGRIEEITGWALYQTDANDDAIVRLKRAVGVLPADSAWWRSSTWRLASALAKAGKDAEALDFYIKSYKTAAPNAFSYATIESLYKKVNGSTDGLELKIGAKPVSAPLPEPVAVKPDPTPEAKVDASPLPSPAESPTTNETPAATPTPAEEPKPTPELVKATPTPDEAKPVESKPEATPEASPVPSIVPIATATPDVAKLPESKPDESPTPSPSPTATPEPTATPAETPVPTPAVEVKPAEEPSPTPSESPTATPTQEVAKPSPEATTKELFPPVIISIPKPAASPVKAGDPEAATKTPEPTLTPTPSPTPATEKPEATPETTTPLETTVSESRPRVVRTPEPVKPCTLTVSEETVTLQSGGGDLAVIVGRTDDAEDLEGLTATSTDPTVVSVRREPIAGVKARALFVLRPGTRAGVFQVKFEMPCGKKDVVVRIR